MDHYTTLGINSNASPEEIKQAYRKLAKKFHPDLGGDKAQFQKISEAYETLGDPQKRAAYDNPPQTNINLNPGFNMGGFGINDILNQMFGHQRQNSNTQHVYRTRVAVSLLDAYNGSNHVFQLHTPGGVKVVNVAIPKGVETGNQIRYDKVIDNATLIVEFIVNPDLRFDRGGNDLYCNVPISILDLITGSKIKVNTINGKTLEVTIKPRTQPFQQIRLPGYGMPTNNGKFGDQILLLKPFMPDNISDEIVEAIKSSNDTPKQSINITV